MIEPKAIRLTSQETIMFNILSEMKIKPEICVQYKVEPLPFVADFAIPDLKIDIEVDGVVYWQTEQPTVERNMARDVNLEKEGWIVLRFDSNDLLDPEKVKAELIQHILNRETSTVAK